MRNKFGGNCYKCGKYCKAGEGYFERVIGKGWRVQHAYCKSLPDPTKKV